MNIKRMISSLYYRMLIRMNEKNTKVNGVNLRYMFRHGKGNDRLIVCFSGFAGRNVRGIYNYIRSLSKSNNDRLFIRDDFGCHGVGSYYLGDSCVLWKNSVIQDLITSQRRMSIKETVFIGSSKGGSAALLYGLLMGVDRIIIGSPQYKIGDYLQENDYHKEILECILDRENGFDEKWLNGLIDCVLDKNTFNGEIDLVYSSKEGGYKEDILPLINAIRAHGIRLNLHDELFENHSQIGMYFINYLSGL